MSKNNTEFRICQLEKNYNDLALKIDEIRTNHLPHLSEDILELKTRINVLTALNVGAIILALIASKFL